MIVKTSQGYQILSKTGKVMSKPDLTLEQAEKRMNQMEWFRNYRNNKKAEELKTYDYGDKGVYEGELVDNKRNGTGTYTWANGTKYIGGWKDDLFHGQSVYTFSDGDCFIGNWEDGKKSGHGTYTWTNGDIYDGEWLNDLFHGVGTFIFSDGGKYVGDWKDGKKHGKGENTWSNGDSYVGEWENDLFNGQGTYTFANGNTYFGEWKNMLRHGQGTAIYAIGDKYTGSWYNDKRHGEGTCTYANGNQEVGQWKDDRFIGISGQSNQSSLEDDVAAESQYKKISDLPDFLFPDFATLKSAYKKKELLIAAPMNDKNLRVYGTKTQKLQNVALSSIYIVLLAGIIGIAIAFSKWIVLLSILSLWGGSFFSSPYYKNRNIMIGFVSILLVLSLIFLKWHWGIIIGSHLASTFVSLAIRKNYSVSMIKNALSSEVMFCWFFVRGYILLKDNTTGENIYTPELSEKLKKLGMNDKKWGS